MLKLLLLLSLLAFCRTVLGKHYKVKVKTTWAQNAGTGAGVWIKIKGEKGETGKMKLNHYNQALHMGGENTFIVDGTDVGYPTEISLCQDNPMDQWKPLSVSVGNNGKAIFNQWLKGDKWYSKNVFNEGGNPALP